MHISGIDRILSSRFYLGKFEYNGIVYDGTHPSIISQELYDIVQEIKHDRNRPREVLKTDKFPYRGPLKCGVCGCAITAYNQKGHDYYHCTNRKYICNQHTKYLRGEYLESIIGQLISDITFDKDMAIKSYEIYLNSKKLNNDKKKELNVVTIMEIETLKDRKDRLLTLYLEKGVDKDTYTKRYAKLNSEINNLSKKIKEEYSSETERWDYVSTIKESGITMKDMFYSGDDIVKKDLLNSLCYNLFIQDGQISSVQYKMPWKVFEKVSKSQDLASWLTLWDDYRNMEVPEWVDYADVLN